MNNHLKTIAKRRPYDAIIIGAGATGLAASKKLDEQGITKHIVLEARNYAGGRIYKDKHYGDLGAASFHIPSHIADKSAAEIGDLGGALDIIFFALRHNFKFEKDDNKFLVFIDRKMVSKGKVKRAFEIIEDSLKQALKDYETGKLEKDISLYDVVGKGQKRLVKTLARTIFSTADSGLDLKKISLIDFLNTVPGTTGIYPDKGMGRLIETYAKEVADYISFRKEVKKFFYHKKDRLVSVEYEDLDTGNRETIHARKLINTMPVGVLQDLDAKSHNLPDWMVESIKHIKMGHLNKIILEMDEKFFDKNKFKPFTNMVIRTSALDEDMIFLVRPNGEPLIVGFVGGETSLKLEDAGEKAALFHALSILKTAFDPKFVEDCFISGKYTMWNSDKYSRGAYSSATIGNFEARTKYSTPVEGLIYMAGEASFDKNLHLHTHVTGAMENGARVANKVYQSLVNERERR